MSAGGEKEVEQADGYSGARIARMLRPLAAQRAGPRLLYLSAQEAAPLTGGPLMVRGVAGDQAVDAQGVPVHGLACACRVQAALAEHATFRQTLAL